MLGSVQVKISACPKSTNSWSHPVEFCDEFTIKHASAKGLRSVTEKNVTFFRSYLRSLSVPPIQLAFSGSNSRSYILVGTGL